MWWQVHKAKLLNPSRWVGAPKDGIVAVKVQYPEALEVMIQDLSNIRVAARFLQARYCIVSFSLMIFQLTFNLRTYKNKSSCHVIANAVWKAMTDSSIEVS